MLGRAQLELDRPQEAEATLKRALEEWSKDYGVKQRVLRAGACRSRPGAGPCKGGSPKPSRRCSRAIRCWCERDCDDQLTATVRRWIEDLYRATGRPQQAQAYFQQVQAAGPHRAQP